VHGFAAAHPSAGTTAHSTAGTAAHPASGAATATTAAETAVFAERDFGRDKEQ
jgi:hypothetical protein